MELTRKYFPDFSSETLTKLEQFLGVFKSWNEKINLVSRKDIDQLEVHHLLHSLAVLKWANFHEGQRILDVGTGGGFPGLPLAIVHPEVEFFLCDSIEKKTKALRSMIEELNLSNVQIVHKRAEKLESKWNFVLGRAVTPIPRFLRWIHDNIRSSGDDNFPCGVLYWKGTLYEEELRSINLEPYSVYPIDQRIDHPYFQDKFIVHLETAKINKVKLPPLE